MVSSVGALGLEQDTGQMRFLADGAKVTHAALESGYSTPSAFISIFRKALGTTPGSYFR